MIRQDPRILFAAPKSGSGKTVITCGFLYALKKREIPCVSFKCGPDYIDPMFHRHVLGLTSTNLDSYFSDEKQIRNLLQNANTGKELAVIEGVMGYYDGLGGTSVRASTYDIARITDTPVILILDGRGSSLSLAAEVKGFLSYREDSRIAGVVLNKTSPAMVERLRPVIEELGVACLGGLAECEAAAIESRHLGLLLPQEQKQWEEKLEILAEELEKQVDLDRILRIAGWGGRKTDPDSTENSGKKRKEIGIEGARKRIGVAMDRAFCFYYQENLNFLEDAGYELVYFSPLADQSLPKHLDALLLGGGYPELYARELSDNQSLAEEIRQAASAGVKILAECGGFLYLHQQLEGQDKKIYPMAGLIPGAAFRKGRLSRFGYVELSGKLGQIRGHEFHYWDSENPGSSMEAQKPVGRGRWTCMHVTETIMAGFPHLYYPSGAEMLRGFLEQKGNGKESKR